MHAILLALLMTGTGIKLDVRTPKASVLPGEPIKLVLRWYGPPDADVSLDDDNVRLRHLKVWVDSGKGFVRFCEALRSPDEGITIRLLPMAPRPFFQNIALVRGEYGSDCSSSEGKSFVFPQPGKYRLKLIYQRYDKPPVVSSNVLTFRVLPPEGASAAILGMIREKPWLLLYGGEHGKRTVLDRDLESPYFSYAKIRAHWEWDNALENHKHPDTGQSLWGMPPADYQRLARDLGKRRAQEVMAEPTWGAFDEDRLDYALLAAQRGGDAEAVARIRAEIARRYPNSELMQRVREEQAEDDDEEDPR